MSTVAIVGSTGLTGSLMLSTLLNLSSVAKIHSISRKSPTETPSNSKLQPIVSPDNSTWAPSLSSISPPPSIFFSGLGTTRGAAGGFEAQRRIDYDLNLALAEAAKKAGVKTYVLISSGGSSSSSMSAYLKMKGQLEDAVKALEFEHTIILRPGLIVGQREESRLAEGLLRKAANAMGSVANVLKDSWAQDASVIAKAAVSAALKTEEKQDVPKVWVLDGAEILKLGRNEWKD